MDFLQLVFKFMNDNQLWFGALFGWIFTRIMAIFEKASVKFELANDLAFTRANRTFKFLNIIIKCNKPNRFKAFLFGKKNINNGRVWIIFKDYSSGIEMLKINGRWASTREPIDVTGQPILSDILTISRENIPAGEEASVTLALKENSETSFFAFNNESYLHNWKFSDYELSDNKYIVEILLLADGNEYKHSFLLTNPSRSLQNFKLRKK